MMRRYLLILLAIILCLGSLAASIATATQRAIVTRGWENAASPDTPLPFRVPHPGVNVELTQYDEQDLLLQLEIIANFDVTWVRQNFPWGAIEPEAGNFTWEPWDAIVEAVDRTNSLQLVAVLQQTPAWARTSQATDFDTAPPDEVAAFERFATAFASRYGDSIDYYQIWDEPNLAEGWGGLAPSAVDYVALLEAAYRAIHAADEQATVLLAGLAPTLEQGPDNFSDVLFLRAIYANGGGPYFDAAAGKPYGFNSGPDDRRVDENLLNFSRLILLREEMVRQGDAEKALWATQFGWNALPDSWSGSPSAWGATDRETQLAYTAAAYARAEREWPWLGGLIVQHWQPDVPAEDPVWGFALLRPDTTTADLPVDLFAEAGLASTLTPGRYHPTTPQAVYQGEWEFSEIGADIGQQGDSQVEFTFDGTAAALELRRDNYRAYLYVAVDEEPSPLLPQDSTGQSYVILSADNLQPQIDTIPLVNNLTPGLHIIHIQADRGWDQWAFAAIRIGEPADTTSYDALLGIILLLLVISAISLVYLARWFPLSEKLPSLMLPLNQAWQLLAAGIASLLVMIGLFFTWTDHTPDIIRRESPGLLLGLVTAGVLYFSPWFVVTLVAAVVLWLLIYMRLELGLLLVVIWSPFFLFPLELYQFAFPMAEVMILLSTSAWLVNHALQWARQYRQQVTRSDAIKTNPLSVMIRHIATWKALDWSVLLLVLLALLTITWSTHQAEAWREWRMMILEPALFYVLLRCTIRDKMALTRLVDALILTAAAVAVISIGMYLNGQGIIMAEGGTQRLAGVYGSPNNVGLFMERALPFALAMLLLFRDRRRQLFAGVSALMMLAAVALSQSVGTILLGLPAGIAVVLVYRRRGLIAIGATVLAGLVAMIPLSQHPRFARLLDFSSGTSFFRLRLWQSTLQMIEDRPLRGLGLDQFLYAYRGRYILPEAWQEPNLSHPHNILLDLWTRLGLGGILLFIWIQITFWRVAWQAYRRTIESPLLRALAVGALGSMASLLVHGLVDNSVFVLDLSYIFMLLLVIPGTLLHVVDANAQS